MEILKNVSLKNYTTFKIGGPADYFADVTNEEELIECIKYANTNNIKFRVIGGGTNLLVCDEGYRGLIIKNSIGGIEVHENKITIGAGEEYEALVQASREYSLTGLEFSAGLPGTVGGAVYGNAGAYGKSIGDFVTRIRIIDCNGEVKTLDREYLGFDYRFSRLKETGESIVWVEVELHRGDKEAISREIIKMLDERHSKHPPYPSMCAGSYFKNLPPETDGGRRVAAGLLLDKVGAKGMKYGGAYIFECHANFMMNDGTGTAKDILMLGSILKEKVKKEFNVVLEEEVIYIE